MNERVTQLYRSSRDKLNLGVRVLCLCLRVSYWREQVALGVHDAVCGGWQKLGSSAGDALGNFCMALCFRSCVLIYSHVFILHTHACV